MININGTPDTAAVGQTLLDYLCSAGYDAKRIAVERNGEIVPKADYGKITLIDGDNLEVVSFVGGG